MIDSNDELLRFDDEDALTSSQALNGDADCWNLLVVDDDPEVHSVTRLALKGFQFGGRPLQVDSAYSGTEARRKMRENQYAIALLDVVMETDHAGLELAQWIRESLNDSYVRLILRTGQPGQAPEREVITNYDINDYKEKTELTANKLFTLICASLRSYRDMVALYQNKVGLEAVIQSTAKLFSHSTIDDFTQGALQQLSALLHLNTGVIYSDLHGIAAERSGTKSRVLAGTGRFSGSIESTIEEVLSSAQLQAVQPVLNDGGQFFDESYFIGVYNSRINRKYIVFLEGFYELSELDRQLVQIFGQNIGVAFDNQSMFEEVELTQREMIYRLSEAVESRSKETSNHVKRMALTCKVLAEAYGLDERSLEVLYKAAPLHDIGKIAIPDHILNKPGKFTPEEWEVMKSHAQIGYDILSTSDLEVLKAGAVIAGGHHENWDGTGYPQGIEGDNIHVYARISSVADVFDALVNQRCYKEAWSLDDTLAFFVEMKGSKFEPRLVDLLIENQEALMTIQDKHAD
jgi:response regulator RpfG family c-di-GMP phosphodiesterase